MSDTVYVGAIKRASVSSLYRRTENNDTWQFCDAIAGTHVHAIAVHPE